MVHFSIEFQQFLIRTGFFSFAPLRSHYVSYGMAHTPICGCQKFYILLLFFNYFTFGAHATFKILALTTGFGYFLVWHRFHGRSLRPVAINNRHALSTFAQFQMNLECYQVIIVTYHVFQFA